MANPPVATLQDNFATLDTTTKWSSSGSYVSVVSGQLNLASPVGSQNPAYISSGPSFAFAPYDLTESAATIQLLNAGNQSLASLVVQPILLTDHYYGYSDSVYWQIAGNQITAFRENGGTTTQLATAAYSSTTHQWLRIREHAGTIYFDCSPNGSVWTNFASGPDIAHVTNLNIQIQGGTNQAEVTATTVILDNFNLAPVISKVATLQDPFTTLDSTKWTNHNASGFSIVSGQLNITSPANSSSPNNLFSSTGGVANFWDLTESAATIQLVNAGNMSLASWQVWPLVLSDNGSRPNEVYWLINQNKVTAGKIVNGAGSVVSSGTYLPNSMVYFRIREHAGTIYFDYSANGNIWINFNSTPDIPNAASLNVSIQASSQQEASASTAIFDNFNLLPVSAVALSGTSGLSVSPIGPKMATLADDFNTGTTPDPTKWDRSAIGLGSAALTNQQLMITMPANQSGGTQLRAGNNSTGRDTYYDLTESYMLAQVISPGDQSVSSGQGGNSFNFMLQDGHTLNQLSFSVSFNQLSCFVQPQGASYTIPFQGTYSPTAHQWMRIREHAGTVYFDVSPDGNIWTNLGSAPDVGSITYLNPRFQIGGSGTTLPAYSAIIDNFNVPPATQVSLTGSTSLLAVPQMFGNTVLSGTSGMALAASVQQYSGITLQGNCSMTAAGMVLEAASAPLAATAGMSFVGQAQQFAVVNEAANGNMVVAGSASSTSPIMLSQTATLMVAATVKQIAASPMSGSAALVVAGSRGTSGTLTQTGVAAMVVAASVQQAAAYSAVVNGKLTVAAVVYGQTSPVLNVTATLMVAATIKEISTVALTGNVSLTILAIKTSNAAVTMTGVASQVTAGARVVVGGVSMVAVTNQVTGGLTVEQGGMVMAATTTLTGSGSQSIRSTVAFNGQASMQASTAPLWMGTMLMSATAAMTAGGYALTGSTFSGAANTTLSTTLVLENLGSVAMAALARLVPVGLTSPVGAVHMAASTSLNIRVFLALSSSVHMSATTSVMVTGTSVVERASIYLRGIPALTVAGTRVRVSGVPLTGAVRLTVGGVVHQHASVGLHATSTLVPVFSVIDWGSIVMPVKATLVATATDKIFTGFTLRATAKLTVSGAPVRLDTVHLVGATGMQVHAQITQVTVVSLSSSTAMEVTGRTAIIGSVVLAGQSSLTIQRALVDMLAVSGLTVSATQLVSPSVDLLGESALEMTTEVEQIATVIMAVATALIVYGRSHGSTPFDWPSLADQLEGLKGMDPSMVHLARTVDDVFPQRLYGPTQ